MPTRGGTAVVGAAEMVNASGRIPELSQLGLQAGAAIAAMKDAGIGPKDVDGIACVGNPAEVAWYLGMDPPSYVDGTSVGGCSFMLHVRHAAAAINEGLCNTVLVTHGESGSLQSPPLIDEQVAAFVSAVCIWVGPFEPREGIGCEQALSPSPTGESFDTRDPALPGSGRLLGLPQMFQVSGRELGCDLTQRGDPRRISELANLAFGPSHVLLGCPASADGCPERIYEFFDRPPRRWHHSHHRLQIRQ